MNKSSRHYGSVIVRRRSRNFRQNIPRLSSPYMRITSRVNFTHKNLGEFLQLDPEAFQNAVYGIKYSITPKWCTLISPNTSHII